MSNEAGIVSFVYNQRDRLITNATPAGTLLYAYDASGNQTNILSTTPNGVSIGYSYDALNRLTNVVDNRLGLANKNTTYAFDAVGNLRGLKYPNGVTNEWQYDRVNRLTNEIWKLNTTTHASFLYTLGTAGHRTALSETVNGSSRNYAWSYDTLYRLTNETINGAAPTGTVGYRMDVVGNRTNRASTISGITNQVFSYNTNDGLTIDAYDSAGNTRTNSGNAFLYDWANRLTNSATVSSISYDVAGNRVKKVVGSGTRLFLVSTINPSGYAQVVEELTISGGFTNLACAYVYGHDLISQRQPSITTNFYGYDGLGSVRFLLNLAGGLAATNTFDAWGSLIANTGTITNLYLFAGEQFDPDLGLYYNRARYYSPGTGRFWSMDTFEGSQSDPLSLHKYLYASANPVNYIDPSGHEFSIVSFTVQNAIRGGISAFTAGSISAGYSYAKGATAGAAFANGLQTAGLVGFSFVSPLAAVSLGAGGLATVGLNIYSGDFTAADAPELATQIGAAIALQLLFKTPAYSIAEVKTVLKVKLPEAATNLKNGNSVKPSRNQLWKQAEATDNAALKGTLMHAELADLMRAQKMSNVGIEVSYDANGVTSYGKAGSIRVDYEVYSGGNVVRVFDLKPSDFIDPSWVQKASRYIQLSPDEISAISYEAFK